MFFSNTYTRLRVPLLAGKKKKVIPWSVCTKTVGREGDLKAKEEYEECIQKVKKTSPPKKGKSKTGTD